MSERCVTIVCLHCLALGSRRRECSEGGAWRRSRGRYRNRPACMTSEVDGTLSCVPELRIRRLPGAGFTSARARSKRDLEASSKNNSRCEGADHHPAAEKRTPSTQAKAACRRTGNTRLEMAARTVRAAFARRTTSGILHRCLSWSVPKCL